jgi:hypothetical protein
MKGGGYAELNTGKSDDIHDISPNKKFLCNIFIFSCETCHKLG